VPTIGLGIKRARRKPTLSEEPPTSAKYKQTAAKLGPINS
jgi:hypothetical protein